MEKQRQKELRVFENPVLEALTRTSPFVTLLVYVPVMVFLLFLGSQNPIAIGRILLFFIGGMFFWTFLEYILHRFVFHYISESKTSQRIHYIIHGIHHHFPRNKERLFMPPVPGLAMVGFLYLIFSFFLGDMVYYFLPGLITGYLCYVFIHYFIHTIKPPKILKPLWTHHFMHHHRFPEKCFGVSTRLWDMAFGTMPPKKNK